jgi:hypothetical protein
MSGTGHIDQTFGCSTYLRERSTVRIIVQNPFRPINQDEFEAFAKLAAAAEAFLREVEEAQR